MKLFTFILLAIAMVLLTSSTNQVSGVSHKFSKGNYHPICEDYCVMEFGYLRITNVTDTTMKLDIEVWNLSLHSGSLDCTAQIIGPNKAIFTEDHGPKKGISTFEFTLDPKYPNNFNISYEGPIKMYHGERVCLEGSFNLD